MYSSYTAETNRHSLDSPLQEARTIGFFSTGSHQGVRVVSAKVEQGTRIRIKLKSITGDTHIDSYPLYTRYGKKWSSLMVGFLAAILPDLESQKLLAMESPEVWENWIKGLKCDVFVVQKEGYELRYNGREFYSVHTKTEQTIAGPSSHLSKVVRETEAKGHKRAYSKIREYAASKYQTDNIRSFLNAAHSAKKAESTPQGNT